MSGLTITQVDPHDDGAVDAWHATYDAALRHGRAPGVAVIWGLEEVRAVFRDLSDHTWRSIFVGQLDGEVVVAGTIEGSHQDNLNSADVFVGTLPESRRTGFGSAMLTHLEAVGHEQGRHLLGAEVHWSYDRDPRGVDVTDVSWAQARGYRLGLVDVQRELDLPVADGVLGRLAADVVPHHSGYLLRSFVGPVPDDLLQGWVELDASLMTEAPMGEIEREPGAVDLVRFREGEALAVRQGRTKFSSAALSPEGEIVAYSDIVTPRHEPEKALQWGTLVRRDHRGHRLGMAVKLANLRLLQDHIRAEGLGVRRLATWNAEVNTHMIGVNEQLGFQPVERLGELQKKLHG